MAAARLQLVSQFVPICCLWIREYCGTFRISDNNIGLISGERLCHTAYATVAMTDVWPSWVKVHMYDRSSLLALCTSAGSAVGRNQTSDRLSDRSNEAFTRYDRRTDQYVGQTSRTDRSVRRSYRVNAQYNGATLIAGDRPPPPPTLQDRRPPSSVLRVHIHCHATTSSCEHPFTGQQARRLA